MPGNFKCVPSILLLLALGGTAPALGQNARRTADSSGASQDSDTETLVAPVVIDGERLFAVRGVTAHPADQRAGDIAARIKALAEDTRFSSMSLTLEEHPGSTWVLANGQRVVVIFDEDAALERINRGTLAELYRTRIAKAIDDYRESRRPTLLVRRAAYAAGVTILLVVVAFAGRRTITMLRTGLERRFQRRVQGIEDRAFQIVKAEQVWRALKGLLDLAWTLIILVVFYFYLHYVLALFPWTRGFANRLLAIVMDPLRSMGLGFVSLIPNFAFLAILIVVTRYGLKLLSAFFGGLADGSVKLNGFDPEWAWPTHRLVRLLVIAFTVVVAYPQIPGSGSDAFKGVSLFIGIIFSLGSSSLMGNFIAGYSMTYRRAFRIGDRVKIGEHFGDVEKVRLLVTHLRTLKNEEVVVPNSNILASEVINYSSIARERGLIMHTTVGIGYETPWRQVEAMLLEAAARTPGLRREPAPFVLHKELGDFCVTYEINAWCDTPQGMEERYTQLHRNILDQFNEYGVQIMTPAYEGDPEQLKVVPKDQWYAAPAPPPQQEKAGPDSERHAGIGR